ncbi:helix-turn-helix domain-containing protein [Actinoplanes sp. NPDC051346]|uniref:helix-turn-helix domain-containing protein n=1 Tax=Actinoplanes sp. NPDC051346 TaxID=3155048 RepID=UPI00341C968B
MKTPTNDRPTLWTPGARRITDGIPLGERADRSPMMLDLWTREHGARHALMGGASGSGKTNTLNVITCGLAACGDAVIWAIEVAKAGQGQAAWLPCFDWLATRLDEAVNMLDAAVAIIDARSRVLAAAAARGKGDDKVMPTPDMPLLVIIIDEAAALFGIKTGDPDRVELAAQATERARQISQTGRSAGVELLVTTQRPTVAALGDDGDFRSQLHPNLCLRMNRRADVGFVLQNVDLDTVDTTLFNVPGLLYVQDGPDVDPLPVRSYALFQPPIVNRLARALAVGRPTLDPVARDAAGEPYAARPADPFQTPATRPAAARQGSPADATTTRPKKSRAATAEALNAARAAATADLPAVPAIPLTDLTPDGNAAAETDASDAPVADAITAVLANAGPNGLTAKEITTASGKHRGSVHRALRTLVDNGAARRVAVGNGYRYHPTTTPESNAA